MLASLLAAAVLGAVASSAVGAPPPDKSKPQIEAPVSAIGLVPVTKDEKVVCRKEALVGSRLYKTVCMSKVDAAERRRLDQNEVRHMQELRVTDFK